MERFPYPVTQIALSFITIAPTSYWGDSETGVCRVIGLACSNPPPFSSWEFFLCL